MTSYRELHEMEMKYADGGRVSTRHALRAVHRAIGHVQRGDHAAAIAELRKSPDAMAHPEVRAAMQQLQGPAMAQGMPGQVTPGQMPGMADGGPVLGQISSNSSSPGTPGVLGAIHDAVAALKDYVIDRPRREAQAQREQFENHYINQGQPGYAEGGKVSLITQMAKNLTDNFGYAPSQAMHMATQYHTAKTAASPVAQQMATDMVHNIKPPGQRVLKTPQQLAQELQSGFVDPQDLQHLSYVDPSLTPLINRYQSGIDNQDLTPEQKQRLIAKLQSMGPGQAGPQMPQPGAVSPGAQQGGQPPPQMRPPGPMPGIPQQQMPQMQPPPGAGPQSAGLSPQQQAALLQGHPLQ